MESIQFYTIQQIDAMKGIRTPHERDLADLGKRSVESFKDLSAKDIEALAKTLGGIVEGLDHGESWTITKEFFPEVKIHILFQLDEEEISANPCELQFLFSGNHVTMISGEDLCLLCGILMNYAISMITRQLPQDIYRGIPSKLLVKAMEQRTLRWENFALDDEIKAYLKFNPFPGVYIEYNIATDPTSFVIYSQKLYELWIYDVERLVIMGLNQILRLVKKQLRERAPLICNLMFSGYYKKMFPEQFQ